MQYPYDYKKCSELCSNNATTKQCLDSCYSECSKECRNNTYNTNKECNMKCSRTRLVFEGKYYDSKPSYMPRPYSFGKWFYKH